MTEAEIIALLTQALPALVDFIDTKMAEGIAGPEIKQAASDVLSWFQSAKFDLPEQVKATDDAMDTAEAIKFGK